MKQVYLLMSLAFLALSLACSTLRAPSTPAPSLEVPFDRPSPQATVTPYLSPTPTDEAPARSTPQASPSPRNQN